MEMEKPSGRRFRQHPCQCWVLPQTGPPFDQANRRLHRQKGWILCVGNGQQVPLLEFLGMLWWLYGVEFKPRKAYWYHSELMVQMMILSWSGTQFQHIVNNENSSFFGQEHNKSLAVL